MSRPEPDPRLHLLGPRGRGRGKLVSTADHQATLFDASEVAVVGQTLAVEQAGQLATVQVRGAEPRVVGGQLLHVALSDGTLVAPSPARPLSRQVLILFVALTALCVATPWFAPYFPTQDGPNHLAVVHILESLQTSGSAFEPYLQGHAKFGPYLLHYGALRLLGRAFGLVTAEKVLASAVVLLLALSMLWFVRRTLPERTGPVFVALPATTGYALLSGFLGFLISTGLVLIALGLAWGRRGGRGPDPAPPSNVTLASAAAVLFCAAIAHPVVPVVTGLCWLALDAPALRRIAGWVRTAVLFGPAAALVVGSFLPGGSGPASEGKLATFVSLDASIYLAATQLAYDIDFSPLRWLLFGLLVAGVLLGARRWGVRGALAEQGAARLGVLLLLLTVLMPYAIGGWSLAAVHVLVFGAFVWPVAVELPSRLRSPVLLGAGALALTIIITLLYVPRLRAASDEIASIVAAGDAAPRGSRVLPLMFPRPRSSWSQASWPLLHAWGHVVLRRDVVTPYLFASGLKELGGDAFRPLSFRRGAGAQMPSLSEFLQGIEPLVKGPRESWHPEVRKYLCSIVAHALVYDRVLVHRPPPPVLAMLTEKMVVERKVGLSYLLGPRVQQRPPPDLGPCR